MRRSADLKQLKHHLVPRRGEANALERDRLFEML